MNNRLPLINLLAYFVLVVVNAIAVRIPFFGKRPGDVSDLFPNLLTPADFTFRIWPLVYVLLGVYALAQANTLFRKNEALKEEVSAIGFWFLISCLLNVSWLLTWQSMHIGLSFALIFALWLVLILIYYRLAMLDKAGWTFTIPFSFYLAWVCISSLANLNVLLMELDFGFFGLSQEYWTAALIGLGIGGTLLMLYLNEDIWFTLVLIWSFFGIYAKNRQLTSEYNWVIVMSLLAMGILLLAGTWVGFRKWRRRQVKV